MRCFWLLVVVVGACVQSDLVPCGESLCPLDKVCSPDGRCLSPSLITQCDDQPDGTPCDALEGIDGRCASEVCEQVACGNGFVDEQLHEGCDGSTDTQCVDFGFDLGRPTCNACGIDTATCTRFGWVRIEYASSQDMWTDGTILAYTTYSPQGIVVHGGGIDATSSRRYFALDGGGGQVYALNDAFVVEHATPTSLEELPATPNTVSDVAVSDDGVPFVLGFDCRVYTYASGAWSEIGAQGPISGTGCSMIAARGMGANTSVVVGGASGPFWVSTDLTHFSERTSTLTQVSDIKLHGDDVWFVFQAGVASAPLTTMDAPTYAWQFSNVTSIAFIGDHIYATTRSGLVVRINGDISDAQRGPTGGRVTDDGNGGLYMYQGPIYRFTGTAFGELESPDLNVQEEQISSSCRLGSRVLAMSDLNLFLQDDAGKWLPYPNVLQPTSYRGIACATSTDEAPLLAVVTHIGEDNSLLGLSNTAPDGINLVDTSTPLKEAVWIAPDGTVIVVGTVGHGPAAVDTSAGWAGEVAPSWQTNPGAAILEGAELAFGTCRFFAVNGLGLAKVVAAGRCDGKGTIIERVAKNDWRLLYQSPTVDGGFRAVLRTQNMIFAAGDNGAAWFDGTAWHTDATVIGRTLSGKEDDLWLSGAFTNVQHFDGMQWSQVATAALSQIAVSASDGDIVFPGGAQGHVNLIRDRQVVPP